MYFHCCTELSYLWINVSGRRHSRGTPYRQQNTREIVSLSPDPVEQVRQMEEDERMAMMLQVCKGYS